MSYCHYIAAPFELESGEFFDKKIQIEKIERIDNQTVLINDSIKFKHKGLCSNTLDVIKKELVIYESEEDAISINISDRVYNPTGIKNYFMNKYIYEVQINLGNLIWNEYNLNISRRSIDVLLEYLKKIMIEGSQIEFFTTWIGEENREIESYLEVDLGRPSAVADLRITDLQYIMFKNS